MRVSNFIKAAIGAYALFSVGLVAINLSAQPADKPPEIPGDFVRGVSLWANTCVRCHNMRDPKELGDQEWRPVMTHMRLRAGLTGQDTRDILTFLQQSNIK